MFHVITRCHGTISSTALITVCIAAGSVLGKEAESIKRKAREETKQAQHGEADPVRSSKFYFAHRIHCAAGVLLLMLSCLKVKREGQREKGEEREEGVKDSSRPSWTELSLSLFRSLCLFSLAPSFLQAYCSCFCADKIELVLHCQKRRSSRV